MRPALLLLLAALLYLLSWQAGVSDVVSWRVSIGGYGLALLLVSAAVAQVGKGVE